MWTVSIEKPALKNVARAPRPERERIFAAIDQMHSDPMTGDVLPLQNERSAVGDWRIFFDINTGQRLVVVTAIERRTTTTYRRR